MFFFLSIGRSRSCNDSFSVIFDENASKDIHVTGTLHNSTTPTLSKTATSADDSFIVFANTADLSKNMSNHDTTNLGKHVTSSHDGSKRVTSDRDASSRDTSKKELSNRILDKVKEYDTFSDSSKKKKVIIIIVFILKFYLLRINCIFDYLLLLLYLFYTV